MSIFINRRNAILITAIVCCAAVLYGSYKSITALIAQSERRFSVVTDANPYPLKDDIITRAGYATNASDLYERYSKGTPSKHANKLYEIYNELTGADIGPQKAYKLNEEINEVFSELKKTLESANMRDDDKNRLVGIETNLASKQDMITRSGRNYNEYASKLKNKINGIPAVLFKTILFTGGVELFGK